MPDKLDPEVERFFKKVDVSCQWVSEACENYLKGNYDKVERFLQKGADCFDLVESFPLEEYEVPKEYQVAIQHGRQIVEGIKKGHVNKKDVELLQRALNHLGLMSMLTLFGEDEEEGIKFG